MNDEPPAKLPSRREMLRRAGAGFGSLALSALLADETRPICRRPPGAPAAALPGAGQARDLPVHARRPVAGRYLRPQAAADSGQRQALAEALPGPDQEPARLTLEVPASTGESGLEVSELFPHVGSCADRSVRHPLDGRRRRQPPRRLPADEHRRAGRHAPEPGRLGDLRPRHREPESARLHRDRPRAADRRGSPVRCRVPAGGVPGHVRFRPEEPDPQPDERPGQPRPPATGARRPSPTQRAASRKPAGGQPARARASSRSSWLFACRCRPPTPST